MLIYVMFLCGVSNSRVIIETSAEGKSGKYYGEESDGSNSE